MQRGALPEDRPGFGDNARIRRYIAKYTINAARTFGIADHVGSLEDGKLADIVVWRPAFFGIKPELVIKSGFIAWGAMGDCAASLMTCEPILMRPQWGAFGGRPRSFGVLRASAGDRARSRRLAGPVQEAAARRGHPRAVEARHACGTTACPNIRVDPETFDVFVDGVLATCEPAERVPLAQRYMLR